MNIIRTVFITLTLISLSEALYALDSSDHIHYPADETVVNPVYFFWHDADNLSAPRKVRFSLTLFNDEGTTVLTKPFAPSINGDFFEYTLTDMLSPGTYRYQISCYRGTKETNEMFSGAYRYPLKGEFSLSDTASVPAPFPSFPQWYEERHINTLENGYNSLFFLSSGTACGVLAYLMLTILDYNIITRVIGYVFAASAVTGYGASAYYGYRYFSVKNDIDRRHKLSDNQDNRPLTFAVHSSW